MLHFKRGRENILCRWFGHRWLLDGLWKLERDCLGPRWKRHDTCKRCKAERTTMVRSNNKPLDV